MGNHPDYPLHSGHPGSESGAHDSVVEKCFMAEAVMCWDNHPGYPLHPGHPGSDNREKEFRIEKNKLSGAIMLWVTILAIRYILIILVQTIGKRI